MTRQGTAGSGEIKNQLNLCIGTTSPNYKLDVNGNINATSYRSNGTDYAEWLEKLNPDEQMEEGDVVAVVNGKITSPVNVGIGAADSYMVVTGRAGYVGNEGCPKDRCVVVSFVGQVPVKVSGEVERGDYIMSVNGTAKAVKPESIGGFGEYKKVIGTAWGSKENEGNGKVLVAIGVK